jgi:hypothetical protein
MKRVGLFSAGRRGSAEEADVLGAGAIDSIARVAGKITFDPRPLKVGPHWQVVAIYPGGQQEHVTGFETESDAKNWITNDSQAWLRKRGYADE